jgi:hypothetical protein
MIRLLSSEGDVFEAPSALMCRYSRLVRELLEEAGPDEEIPLPGVKSGTLVTMLELCEQLQAFENKRPGGLRQDAPCLGTCDLAMVLDLDWAAKLMRMDKIQVCVLRTLASFLENGDCGCWPYLKLSPDLLWRILSPSASPSAALHMPSQSMCELIQAAVGRTDPGENAAVGVSCLVGHLNQQDEVIRDAAIEGLVYLGSVDGYRALLTHRSNVIRIRTVRSLNQSCCPETLELAKQLLKDVRWEVRETALQTIVAVAYYGDSDLCSEEVAPMLADACREVREAAVGALGRLSGSDDSSTMAAVVARLKHKDWPVRCAALRALSKLCPDNFELLEDAAKQVETGSGMDSTVVKHYAARLRQGIASRCAAEADVVEREDISSRHRLGAVGRTRSRPRWGDLQQ